ncbi:MAG: hypoxanthine phosphoribosyltransferase [Prevotellaceae bacterium]|jgi:hypoxanthine phosphoribosyltransferase|nr:hypoxanthine phosphoribosyltransferase [Prevotellaceae bacterium]
MKKVALHDKTFVLFIANADIQTAIDKVAQKINAELAGERPLFISLLNGAFMFTADLLKSIDMPCEVSFIKYASYAGVHSTGEVAELIGLNVDVKGRTVVILEDIIDTGITIANLLKELEHLSPKTIKIATMLYKPNAFKEDFTIDYVGVEIPNDFIVGYGLDYDGLGRNLKDIYTLEK